MIALLRHLDRNFILWMVFWLLGIIEKSERIRNRINPSVSVLYLNSQLADLILLGMFKTSVLLHI